MSEASHEVSKQTTQDAPLEGLLTWLRTRKVKAHTLGKSVLDFGCGRELKTLRGLEGSARFRAGVDACFLGKPPMRTADGIEVVGSLKELSKFPPFECVTALACFEHIEPEAFPGLLRELAQVTAPGARILGTVPTPPAKPVLEFLSFRLGLIDRTQIEDHKIYYDRGSLSAAVERGGWRLERYARFQLGLNSFFILNK